MVDITQTFDRFFTYRAGLPVEEVQNVSSLLKIAFVVAGISTILFACLTLSIWSSGFIFLGSIPFASTLLLAGGAYDSNIVAANIDEMVKKNTFHKLKDSEFEDALVNGTTVLAQIIVRVHLDEIKRKNSEEEGAPQSRRQNKPQAHF